MWDCGVANEQGDCAGREGVSGELITFGHTVRLMHDVYHRAQYAKHNSRQKNGRKPRRTRFG